MKNLLLIILLLTQGLVFAQNPNETDSLFFDTRTPQGLGEYDYVIVKGNNINRFGRYAGMPVIFKKKVLVNIEDFPKLHSIVSKHYKGVGVSRDLTYVKNILNCYNNYMFSENKPTLDFTYFSEFGLASEIKSLSDESGSSQSSLDELLKTKQPIHFEVQKISVTTTTTYSDLSTSSTYGETYRSRFTYGYSPLYKSGFLLKNLKKAIGDDKKAQKHIRKYRANWAARTFLPFALAGGMYLVGSSTGLVESAPPVVFIPMVFVLNWWMIFPQKYKTKNIRNAVDTYNKNL
jgi:hypothetical protein